MSFLFSLQVFLYYRICNSMSGRIGSTMAVLKSVEFLLTGRYAVLCLPFMKLERTAGAGAQGLRGHFETVLLGSDVGR